MGDIDEERVYRKDTEARRLFIISADGIIGVDVVEDRIGQFRILHDCAPRDIAAGTTEIAVATTEDVLLGGPDTFQETGFGGADAVGYDGTMLLAARQDGSIGRFDDDQWTLAGRVDSMVHAISGDLAATDSGIYRLREEPVHVGLSNVRDVSCIQSVFAATESGLYVLGNGWMDELPGDFMFVSERIGGDEAHAATPHSFYRRTLGSWREIPVPASTPPVAVTYAESAYGVTQDGTLLSRTNREWRTQPLGLENVTGLATPHQPYP